jgi:hypothetical protein
MVSTTVLEDGENIVKQTGHSFKVELNSLLIFMELLGDPPKNFCTGLLPKNAELVARSYQLRERLPSYLEKQPTSIIAHCPLTTVLQSIVAAYAPPRRIYGQTGYTFEPLKRRELASQQMPTRPTQACLHLALSSLAAKASVNDGAELYINHLQNANCVGLRLLWCALRVVQSVVICAIQLSSQLSH